MGYGILHKVIFVKYIQSNDRIILTELDSFDIASVLECGQCFRFAKLGEGFYRIIAFGKLLFIRRNAENTELFPTNSGDFESIWRSYFDLDRDYSSVKLMLAKDGEIMKNAVDFSPGIRHLSQDPFECLISFIISQNNRIPMIMKCVENICTRYGKEISEGFYAFPTAEELARADISGLSECRVGFRAKYIIDAVNKVLTGEIDLNKNTTLTTGDLRENLKKIKGVGDKVADCVMLFAYGRAEVFPADVWIIKAMSRYFFDGRDINKKELHSLAYERFGQHAGMANQYLYNYIRTLDTEKSKE